ncbi:MAG: hypothetical protein Q8P92_03895 [Candidatus Daviesbacteria bacterium]|nr:hypothetical protein [Candidatus Daviesbacteria bacterium]
MNNPCIRCGKQRIESKSWEEKMGASVITYSLTVCPDRDCQKIVDEEIAERKEKADLILRKKEEAKLAREKLIATN